MANDNAQPQLTGDEEIPLEGAKTFVPREGSGMARELFDYDGKFAAHVGKISFGRSDKGHKKLIIPLILVDAVTPAFPIDQSGKRTVKDQSVEGKQDRKDGTLVFNIEDYYKALVYAGIATQDDINKMEGSMKLKDLAAFIEIEGTVLYFEAKASSYTDKKGVFSWSSGVENWISKSDYETAVSKGEHRKSIPAEAIEWRRAKSAAGNKPATATGAAGTQAGATAGQTGGQTTGGAAPSAPATGGAAALLAKLKAKNANASAPQG